MRIIRRRECAEVSRLSSWTLVYGRRKVGKMTLLKNCLRSDLYVLIGYGGSTAVVSEEITAVDNVLREIGGCWGGEESLLWMSSRGCPPSIGI